MLYILGWISRLKLRAHRIRWYRAAPQRSAVRRNIPHDRRANGTSPIGHEVRCTYDATND